MAPTGFPDISAGETLSGPFAQAWSAGALRMSRGEGIWYSYGKMFIVDTSTGVDSQGQAREQGAAAAGNRQAVRFQGPDHAAPRQFHGGAMDIRVTRRRAGAKKPAAVSG